MAVQLINVGNLANDGTGDDLREAFVKVNSNFEELDLRNDEKTTASNIGATGEGIFAQKINYDLQFKKLVAGSDVTLTATDNTIIVDANGGLKSVLVVSDLGSTTLTGIDNLTISGGDSIQTRLVNNTLTIDYNGITELSGDTTPQLGGNLDAQGFNISNVGSLDAASVTGFFQGNLEGLVYGRDIREIFAPVEGFDFGLLIPTIDNTLDWLISTVDVDFGSFNNPTAVNVDLGGLAA